MPDRSDHRSKLRDILAHPFGEKHAADFNERSISMLANHIGSLKKRRIVYFERRRYGRDAKGDALLATVVGGTIIPDYDFLFCWGREIVERYGIEAAVVAAYARQEIKRVGNFTVDTRTGKIFPTKALDVEIHIQTLDRNLRYDLLEKSKALDTLGIDDEFEIADEIVVTYKGTTLREEIESPDTIKFVLSIGAGVVGETAAGVVANWLYQKLKSRKGTIRRIMIGSKEVAVEVGRIMQALEEKMRFT